MSNSRPARNIVMIYPTTTRSILKHTFPNTKILQSFSLPKSGKQKCCICKNTRIHSLFLQTCPWPLNQKHYSVFSIDHFESNFVNPVKYESGNKPKNHIKNINQKIKHYPREKSLRIHHYPPVNFKLPLRLRLGQKVSMLALRRYVDNLDLLPFYQLPQ